MANEGDGSNTYLPIDILLLIFMRLTVKALIRCTGVCKTWYNLIRSPNFIAFHLNSGEFRLDRDQDAPILFGKSKMSHLVDKDINLLANIPTPFDLGPSPGMQLNFVGSCNGVICLAPGHEYNPGRNVYLWNPAIRVAKRLPNSIFSHVFHAGLWVSSRLGFGYLESEKDYRVVRLIYLAEAPRFKTSDVQPLIEIYSMKSNSWKMIQTPAPWLIIQSALAFHNGCLYWMGLKRVPGRPLQNYILQFSLITEEFRQINQPQIHYPYTISSVRASADALYAVSSKAFCRDKDKLKLWKMNQGAGGDCTWTEAHAFTCRKGIWWALGFANNRFLYIDIQHQKKVVSFDLASKEVKLHKPDFTPSRLAVNVNYMESLELLDQVRGPIG